MQNHVLPLYKKVKNQAKKNGLTTCCTFKTHDTFHIIFAREQNGKLPIQTARKVDL